MPLGRSRNHSNPGKTLKREWDPLLLGLNQVPSPKGPGMFKEMQKSVRSVSKLSCGLPEETNPTWSCGILLCPILASLEPEHLEPESPISPPMLLNSPMHDSYFSAYLAQSDFGLKTSCHKGLHFPTARKPTISASLSLCSTAPSLQPLGDPKHFDVGSWCKSQKQHFRLSMMLHFIDKSWVLNMIDVFECSTCFLSHASTFLGCAEEHRYGADMSETGCHSFSLLAYFTLAKDLLQVQVILQLNSNCRAPNLAMMKSSPCFFSHWVAIIGLFYNTDRWYKDTERCIKMHKHKVTNVCHFTVGYHRTYGGDGSQVLLSAAPSLAASHLAAARWLEAAAVPRPNAAKKHRLPDLQRQS